MNFRMFSCENKRKYSHSDKINLDTGSLLDKNITESKFRECSEEKLDEICAVCFSYIPEAPFTEDIMFALFL